MGLDNSKILMVIPLFNHGDTIRSVAEKALAAGWPVLVVDDVEICYYFLEETRLRQHFSSNADSSPD